MYKLNKKGGKFAKLDTPRAKGEASAKALDEKLIQMQGQIAELTAKLEEAGKYAENADNQIAELTAKLEELSKQKK